MMDLRSMPCPTVPVRLGVIDGQRESRLFYMYRFHFRRILWALLGVLLPCLSVRLDNRPLDSVVGYDHLGTTNDRTCMQGVPVTSICL